MQLTPAASLDLELPTIAARLAVRSPRRFEGEAARWAAVAAILRRGRIDTELLLIRRAERDGDPWSGHMALPGGHQHATDPDLLATAIRETQEEVGIDLGQHVLLGALDQHAATARGRFMGMVIAPYVFGLRHEVELSPNHEVAELVWAPLGRMARGETDVVKELQRDGELVRFEGFGVGEHVVWGLTHRVLSSFFSALAG